MSTRPWPRLPLDPNERGHVGWRRCCGAADMRRLDATAVAAGMPAELLMENASRAVARAALRWLGASAGCRAPGVSPRVLVLCGPGNNGGDGYGAARTLYQHGVNVSLAAFPTVPGRGPATAELRLQLALCAAIAGSARWQRVELPPGDLLRGGGGPGESGRFPESSAGSANEPATNPARSSVVGAATRHLPGLVDWLRGFDLVIDALFGTGLARALDAPVSSLLGALVASAAPVLAVDLPSGLDADDGRLWGPVAPAIGTVTFGAWKLGLLGPQGRALAGNVEVAEIGLPLDLVAALPGLPLPG